MNTQYKKNLKDAMTACKNYTDKKIDDLKWELGSHTLDVSSDTDVAFSKSVPANTIGCQINKIGGMSYKSENLIELQDIAETTTNGITYKVENDVITLNGTTTSITTIILQHPISLPVGTYTWALFNASTCYNSSLSPLDNNLRLEFRSGGAPIVSSQVFFDSVNKTKTFTTTSSADAIYIRMSSGLTITNFTFKPMLVSGSTAPTTFKTYFSGIRDSAVTSVVSKGANLLQLVANTSGTVAGVRYNISNGVLTLNGTSTSTEGFWISLNTTVTAGEYYFKIFNPINQGNSTFIRLDNAGTSAVALVRGTSTGTRLTLSEGEFKAFFWIGSSGITFNNLVIYPMLVSGSTAPSEFIAYEGTIATTTIPSEVQSLTGYGWGVNDTCYNYINFEIKKFVKKVGRVDLETISVSNIVKYDVTVGTLFRVFITDVKITDSAFVAPNAICIGYTTTTLENRANMTLSQSVGNSALDFINNSYSTVEAFKTAMSGVYLYYELAEPVETDISEYLDDNSIEVEPNGTLTFNNTYEQAVPSDIDYLIEEVKA